MEAGPQISIRKMTADDIPAVARLLKDMWISHSKEAPELVNADFVDAVKPEIKLAERVNDSNHLILVAEADGAVVATARASIINTDYPVYPFTRFIFYDDLAIHPNYRGKGIANRFHEMRAQFGKDNGINVFKSKVYSFNEATQGLVQKHGFKEAYRMYYKFTEE